MRVITGIARGARLLSPDGNDIRPTSDKVKESIFSAIQFDIEGASVLDLFAGSGQLGIEALSRGAKCAVFVDKSSTAVGIVKKNLSFTHLQSNATVINADYSSFFMQNQKKFDIAFLDPPYLLGMLPDALLKTSRVMNPNSIIVCEHPHDLELCDEIGDFYLRKRYKFSKVCVSIFRYKELD